MEKYNIKQATIDDIGKLADLFDLYRIFYEQKSDISKAKQFLYERINQHESIVFIVEETEKKECIGFTQLFPSFSSISMERSWILNDLYVKIEHRGNGIAKLLLEKANSYAIDSISKGLSLSTSISNVRAQQLYEEFGFIKDDEFYHYYKRV